MSTTSPPRRDDLSQYFAPVEQAETVSVWLFRTNMALSLASLLGETWTKLHAPGILEAALLVLVVIQLALGAVIRLRLFPHALDRRRKQLLANAMGAMLTDDRTEGYYNNPLPGSLKRLAVNTFENSLFSKEIVAEMLVRRRWRAGIYLLVWLALVIYRRTTMEALAFTTQVVFSADVVADWLNLEVLSKRHQATFDWFYSFFASRSGYTTAPGQANILDAVIGYECDKARAGVQQSTAIFAKRNAELSKKWDQIRKDVGIDPEEEPTPNLLGGS